MNANPTVSDRVVPMLEGSPFEADYGKQQVQWTTDDRNFLDQKEKVIESGKKAFLKVSDALEAIRDYKGGLLYLETHGTFKEYCTARWGFSTQHVYRHIAAAKVVNLMSPRGDIAPEILHQVSERHARELNRIPDDDDRAELLREVAARSGGKVPGARELEREVDCFLKKQSGEAAPNGAGETGHPDNAAAEVAMSFQPVDDDPTGDAPLSAVSGDDAGVAPTLHRPIIHSSPLIVEQAMQAALDEIDDRKDLSSKQRKFTRHLIEEVATKLNDLVGDAPDDDIRTSVGRALECVRDLAENG